MKAAKKTAPEKARARPKAAPKVGFVSLGCPKALVDSERILTQLRAEGYLVAPTYEDADLVVVNTCGFIDAAVEESLDAIGEALAENGKVIVTGCLGAKGNIVKQTHPRVLAVTGPHATDEVMRAVHAHLPQPHDPYTDLIPPQGIKLTPRHYAYLKIAEGCNHRCTFCIIPSMRGDLVSRPIGDVMQEAENLVKAGVKELLVISQDTSAYGVDIKYRTGFWRGRPLKTRMTELAGAALAGKDAASGVGAAALCLPLSARRRSDSADGGGKNPAVSRRAVPAREPEHTESDETPGKLGEQSCAHQELARDLSRAHDTQHFHRRLPRRNRRRFRATAGISRGSTARPRRLLCLFAGRRREGERAAGPRAREKSRKNAKRAS